MKRILWILGFSALVLSVVSCDLNSLNVPLNDGETGNNIYVNPNTHWPPSKTPAYIGDISAYPQELQNVIKQRFSKQVSMETAGVIFAGPSELSAHADKLTDAANSCAFVVTPTFAGFGIDWTFGFLPLALLVACIGVLWVKPLQTLFSVLLGFAFAYIYVLLPFAVPLI